METNIIPKYKDIGVLFSAGVDSSLMLYQLSKTHPESNIHLWIGSRLNDGQFHLENVEKVLNFLKPNVKTTAVFTFKDRPDGRAKRDKLRKQFVEQYKVDCMVNGLTLNPTEDLGEGRDERRDTVRPFKIEIDGYEVYRPFIQMDKKGIAKLYEDYELKKSLLPLTVSCEAIEPPRPCKECWWCKEKFWGFGEY